MLVTTVNGVLRHCSLTGNLVLAGYTTEEAVSGLVVSPLSALDPEDATDARYALAQVEPLHLLDTNALTALSAGEVRRLAVAKLTDAELATLGVERDPA